MFNDALSQEEVTILYNNPTLTVTNDNKLPINVTRTLETSSESRNDTYPTSLAINAENYNSPSNGTYTFMKGVQTHIDYVV